MLSLMVKMAKKGTRPTISNPTIIVSIPILIASVMVTLSNNNSNINGN